MHIAIYLSSDAVGFKEKIDNLMTKLGWKIKFVDSMKKEEDFKNFIYVQYEQRHLFKDIIEKKMQPWAKLNGGGKNYGNTFVVLDMKAFVNPTESEQKAYEEYKDVWYIVEKDTLDSEVAQNFTTFFLNKMELVKKSSFKNSDPNK